MPPTSDAVLRELERVLSSDTFANSRRLSRFLRFVVETAVAGDADRLKEYAIGIDVFDRDARYDPRVDSIVRVEAGRLRTKLDEYYGGDGRGDPVAIGMRKGSYVPSFEARELERDCAGGARERRHAGPALGAAVAAVVLAAAAVAYWRADSGTAADASRPRIAVLPFAPYGADPAERIMAERLTEGVTAELVRAQSLGVVSSTSARQFAEARGSLRDVARTLDADLLVEARLLVEGHGLRVEARLVGGGLNEKMWVESFVGDPGDPDELEQRIAAAVLTAARQRHTREGAEGAKGAKAEGAEGDTHR